MLTYIEEYHCPACDCVIPKEHIHRSKIDRHAPDNGRQVRVWCEHCDRVYKAEQILEGGVWQIVGQVELVTDERQRRAFRAKISDLRGDRQLVA